MADRIIAAHVQSARVNPATRTITSVLGVGLAIAGVHHGVLEVVLQGNRPTGGFFIMAIGQGQLMWPDGTEGAFTLIPNFLATGIAAICVSILVVLWSVFFLHRQHAPSVFLLLLITLTLVGGGIGHIAFFVPVWAYATRIDKPLDGWKSIMPGPGRAVLRRVWVPVLGLAVLAFVIALELSVFGVVAGIGGPDTVNWICWSFLAASLALINLAYACGAAYDIEAHAIAEPRSR